MIEGEEEGVILTEIKDREEVITVISIYNKISEIKWVGKLIK